MTTVSRRATAPLPQRGAKQSRLLTLALVVLASALGAAALLGPVGVGLLEYRTSDTTLNQLRGSDTAVLAVAVPLALLAAVLVSRGRRAGAPLAAGVALFALYTYAQVIIGQEYLRLPGNVERFFPLLLGVFVVAEAVLVFAWGRLAALPRPGRRLARTTGGVLLAVALFLVVGLHLPSMLTAWTSPESLVEYVSAPTPFWLVKLMDLGIVVPVAIVTGVALLRRDAPLPKVLLPLLSGYSCLGASVFTMALIMLLNNDPDASLGLSIGFGLFTAALAGLTIALYRTLAVAQTEGDVVGHA